MSDALLDLVDGLIYADAFDCALTLDELRRYARRRVGREELARALCDGESARRRDGQGRPLLPCGPRAAARRARRAPRARAPAGAPRAPGRPRPPPRAVRARTDADRLRRRRGRDGSCRRRPSRRRRPRADGDQRLPAARAGLAPPRTVALLPQLLPRRAPPARGRRPAPTSPTSSRRLAGLRGRRRPRRGEPVGRATVFPNAASRAGSACAARTGALAPAPARGAAPRRLGDRSSVRARAIALAHGCARTTALFGRDVPPEIAERLGAGAALQFHGASSRRRRRELRERVRSARRREVVATG